MAFGAAAADSCDDMENVHGILARCRRASTLARGAASYLSARTKWTLVARPSLGCSIDPRIRRANGILATQE
jgi:hypothetical protein